MKITVVHKAFEDTPTNVALVNVPSEIKNVNSALEYAYRWTNNVMGSWSRDDIENNGDENPNVTPLFFHPDGMGVRSTSMGDQMIVDNNDNITTYEVAMLGFEEVA